MDELDLALVNALQHDPRAPWSRLARPLGVDAATLSRRWARLSAAGEAWVTCYAGPSQVPYAAFALVEVGCVPGEHERIAARIARDPLSISVEQTTGNRDLLLTVSGLSVAHIGTYVLERIGKIDGVTFTRTHLCHRLYTEGSRWRLDSLSQDQRRDLMGHRGGRGDGPDHEPGKLRDDEVNVMVALGADGRRSVASLAAGLGMSEARVRRALTGMISSARAVLRCEVAHRLTGWNVTGMLWLDVPPARRDDVATVLSGMREVRLVCSVFGRANLMANIWGHGLEDLAAFQTRIAARFPEIGIVEQSVTLKWVKRMGRLVDEQGRSIGQVTMDIRGNHA
ncbi:Lrp/AsnC family transcriptional regulator [Actinomadura sediminis]|uniref:Lrp/AsnC family transcriptional regulator n=1 Tax=Actinomadura sediminis TaxID=1038904 RepID=A0ABW3EGR4_9ACTN